MIINLKIFQLKDLNIISKKNIVVKQNLTIYDHYF